MDVTRKSIGEIIDALISTDIRCWKAQDEVMSGKTDAEIAKAAITAQKANLKRNQLIRAINEILGEEEYSPSEKTYG